MITAMTAAILLARWCVWKPYSEFSLGAKAP
jgi:hypothetical protein